MLGYCRHDTYTINDYSLTDWKVKTSHMSVLHCHVPTKISLCSIFRWVVILCHVSTCLHCMSPFISVISLWRGTNDWNSTTTIIFHYFPGQDSCLTHTGCGTLTTKQLCASKNEYIAKTSADHTWLLINAPTLGLITKCNNNHMLQQRFNFWSTTGTSSNICIHNFLMTSC